MKSMKNLIFFFLLSIAINLVVVSQRIPQTFDVFNVNNSQISGENNEPYFQFREQNVIVTNSGKTVVVTQARNKSNWSDRSGEDLWCKISNDYGNTWSNPNFVAGHGEFSIVPNATVYDGIKNRITVLYNVFTWDYTDAPSRKTVKQKNKQYKVYSDDEGLTWTAPKNISHMMKVQNVPVIFGSGEGIQLRYGKHKGRLIIPGGDFSVKTKRLFNFYSDDGGLTWKTSEDVPNPDNKFLPVENSIAEMKDGTLILNERSNEGYRRQAYSYDQGENWTQIQDQLQLPDVSCNASIINIDYKGKEILLYAGPVGTNVNCTNGAEYKEKRNVIKRMNGTIFASFDQGKTWPFRKLIVPDKFAYSSLTKLTDESIGLFYEADSHKNINLIKFSLEWLFSNNKIIDSSLEREYNLSVNYPKNGDGKLKYIGVSPMNEATVQVFEDGVIRIYHTDERFGNKVMMSESVDGGYNFSPSIKILQDSLISQYPRRTLIDNDGNLHMLVFKKKVLDVFHTVSTDNGKTWAPLNFVTKGRVGAIRGFIQTENGRLVFGYHRRELGKESPTGSCYTSSVFSDDNGKTWINSTSKLVAPVFENYNGNNYGLVEPNIAQLTDGTLKMYGRTQTGFLYESESKNNGETWTAATPSPFHSSNSPASLFKLPNGNLLLTWCNTVDSDLETFGRIYTNRETLHMAVTKDNGKTWVGFREVVRIPSRNDQSNMVREDSGVSYPNVNFTKEEKIILVCGQGEKGGGRSIFLIDPSWLEEKEIYEDFSTDLEKWSCYSFVKLGLKPHRELGAKIVDDPTAENGKALLINKEEGNMFADGAVLNFPMGRSGEVQTRIKFSDKTVGIQMSLTDHFSHPNDIDGSNSAMYTYSLIYGELGLKTDLWYDMKLKWDLNKEECLLYINSKLHITIPISNKTETGISYIRFQNLADKEIISDSGMKIDWIKSKI